MQHCLNIVQTIVEILCLTLYRAIVNYRRERGANVLRVLVQHNIFYFGCGVGKFVIVFSQAQKSNAPVASSVVLIVVIALFPVSTRS